MTTFDKSSDSFPVKKTHIFLNHCGVSAGYSKAAEATSQFMKRHSELGNLLFKEYGQLRNNLYSGIASLFQTSVENVSFMHNSAEGLSMIANGYPFNPGDEIVSYVHEYPSNHYPWKIQERRGVVLKLIPNSDATGKVPMDLPASWSIEALERLITPRTRVVALSHVQFTSGYAADLATLGALCKSRNIDLVIDAAQSLGCMPVYPELYNIAAVVSSGWKWLLGPIGCGVMFTSPEFRAKVSLTMVGPDMMTIGDNYLDHRWCPVGTARCFEYSTIAYPLAAGLEITIRDLFVKNSPEKIFSEVKRLQNVFLSGLDRKRYTPVEFAEINRSGILALVVNGEDPVSVMGKMLEKKLVVTSRGGFLRIAPHFNTSDDEIGRALEILNS